MLFLKRDADTILSSMLERVKSETSITVTSVGSVTRSLFEIIADELGADYDLFDVNMQQLFISTASGDGLDKIGEIFGVVRTTTTGSAAANSGSVYFYLNSSADHVAGTADMTATQSITIPAGTRISTGPITVAYNPVLWKTTSSCTIPANGYLAYAEVEPINSLQTTVGVGKMIYHNLNTDTFSDVYVYNKRDLETNSSLETDSNFRYRISRAVHEVGTGNSMALRLAALATAGVKDVKVLPLAEGIGTVKVVVVLENPATQEGTAAFTNASGEINRVASVGDLVFIERPNELGVDITGVLLTKSGTATSSLKTAAKNMVTSYLEKLSVGEPIIYSKLISDAMNISPDIREFAVVDGGFTVGGVPVARSNYYTKETDQVYPQTITVL